MAYLRSYYCGLYIKYYISVAYITEPPCHLNVCCYSTGAHWMTAYLESCLWVCLCMSQVLLTYFTIGPIVYRMFLTLFAYQQPSATIKWHVLLVLHIVSICSSACFIGSSKLVQIGSGMCIEDELQWGVVGREGGGGVMCLLLRRWWINLGR